MKMSASWSLESMKKKRKRKKKRKKKRKNTYMVDGAPMEGFAPHKRRVPLPPSVHLRERASPRLK